MNWSAWIRQAHRWLSIAFTVAVIANFVAMGHEPIALWVGGLTLLPLALLLFTGLYMFVLPHATRWRSARRTHETAAAGYRRYPRREREHGFIHPESR